jgi:hypothetical protein
MMHDWKIYHDRALRPYFSGNTFATSAEPGAANVDRSRATAA